MKYLSLLLLFSFNSFARIEYRLVAKSDDFIELKWRDGKKMEKLEKVAFLSKEDFFKATHEKTKAKSLKGIYDVRLLHSKVGKNKYREVANKDRGWKYCIIFNMEILQCLAFPPIVKGLYDKGSTIYGSFSQKDAKKLSQLINDSLK